MLTLYHLPVAICAQKVRVCLAEKGVEWTPVDVTGKLRTREYLALNPAGYVPTLIHDERIITESRIISEYIDEALPGPALQPADPFVRSVMRRWTKQVDDSLHGSVFLLTFVPYFRDRFMVMSDEELTAAMPVDPIKAQRVRDLMNDGWQSPLVRMGLARFARLMADMEVALGSTAWLAGNAYSLADADLTPYFQRLEDLGLAWLWADCPKVADWYRSVQQRPSFRAVVADWFSVEERAGVAARAGETGMEFRSMFAD